MLHVVPWTKWSMTIIICRYHKIIVIDIKTLICCTQSIKFYWPWTGSTVTINIQQHKYRKYINFAPSAHTPYRHGPHGVNYTQNGKRKKTEKYKQVLSKSFNIFYCLGVKQTPPCRRLWVAWTSVNISIFMIQWPCILISTQIPRLWFLYTFEFHISTILSSMVHHKN